MIILENIGEKAIKEFASGIYESGNYSKSCKDKVGLNGVLLKVNETD